MLSKSEGSFIRAGDPVSASGFIQDDLGQLSNFTKGVLESEVESIILDPNAPQYVNEWGNRVKQKLFEIVQRQANR